MEMEVQKHKDSFFTMRRELETAKAEYETYSINQANEVRAIREEHEAVQAVLRDQIARLQDKDALIEKDDQISKLTQRLSLSFILPIHTVFDSYISSLT